MDKDNYQETKRLLHKLVYQALIEIREEAYLIENKKIHALADLVHNLPLQLLNPDNNLAEILEKLKPQADSIGAGKWLESTLKQL